MKALVFDSQHWAKEGDVDDNLKFWKPATIIREYLQVTELGANDLVDVIFDEGHRSNGHFKSGIKP
jgi:hypothetical protein